VNKSELARKMLLLAIKDSGLSSFEFIERAAPLPKGYGEQLKRRVMEAK
jgi:hypothetical protein